ncbi:synaptonemal complex protein 2-like isoform X3 [Scyliorhinus canicula]|uniref:synaptonemal complex protein 2-like isoform X3 n=1 Tax=Scyliorhinus canicula TaxID=7830 RepID=UPI0018F62CBA|nr:synaptonemal complex protein 2-like isoform X3 [Scyliorhinus canicula]
MKNSSGRSTAFEVRLQDPEPGNTVHLTPSGKGATKHFEEKSCKKITARRVAEILQEEENESLIQRTALLDRPNDIVPDSQPVVLKEKPLLPGLLESVHKDLRSFSKKKCWVSDSPASSCSTLERQTSRMKYTFQFDDRRIKHQTFYSIFDEKSPCQDHRNKLQTVEQLLTDKAEKVTPKERHKKCGTHMNDVKKRMQLTVDGRLLPTSPTDEFPKIEGVCLHSICETETMASVASMKRLVMTNQILDGICHGAGPKEQKIPQRGNYSKIRDLDLTCKYRPKDDEWENGIRKESTISETMISAIAAKYTNEQKAKLLNKDVNLLNRYELDESQSLIKKQKKKLKDEKGTDKGQKRVAATEKSHSRMEDCTADVYSFVGSSTDEPTITLGMKYKTVSERIYANKRETEKKNVKSSLTKKEVCKSSGCRNKKYFSIDTDTDGKTDVSWLRESNRKIKPKLVVYTRQKKENKAENLGKEKVATPHKKHCDKKSIPAMRPTEKISSGQPERKQRICPRRSAAMQQCYKEASESEFDSREESLSSSPKRERNLTLPKEAKKVFKNSRRKSNLPNISMKYHELSEVSSHSFTNTSSVEKIRYEKTCEPTLSTRPTSPLESETSIQAESLPESLQSTYQSTAMKSCKLKKGFLKIATSLPSPDHSGAKATFNSGSSPIVSPNSLSCELNEKDEDIQQTFLAVNKTYNSTTRNRNCSSESSVITARSSSNFTIRTPCSKRTAGEENLSTSAILQMSQRGVTDKVHENEIHISGPSSRASVLKRICGKDHQSNFNAFEEDEKTKDQATGLRPRKLFKYDFGNQSINADAEFQSPINDDHSSIKKVDNWELNEPNMGIVCQRFTNELKVKFQEKVAHNKIPDGQGMREGKVLMDLKERVVQLAREDVNRSWADGEVGDVKLCENSALQHPSDNIAKHAQRVDTFTKFSLKSLQQRMSSTSLQIHGYRLKRLNKFQSIFTQELEHFEKDSQSLKAMEKELTSFWKKHSKALSEMKENEEQRIQHLRSSFENNLRHSVEFEEQIFSTEMRLMRKDMKTCQARLLKEMQEEELVTVRRGLQSFFLSEGTPF